ncbi:carbohydrate esterase family 8 protein [Mycena rosella]|uniref:pectinesterase n=1 Tax=Mycena rosella TaxID=1033263 RepID=A0AAD7CAH5_MYCRO|nr:carbohydrate esterase family 8 protein [Mycena rosella]
MLATKLIALLVFCAGISAQPRTVPPDAAVIVRGSGTQTGEFHTIQAAFASLPSDSSAQVIFLYPWTYTEQVHLTRAGNLTMMGYTENTKNYAANTVRLSFNLSQGQVGGGDLAAMLRIDTNNFSLYNIDVVNTFGPHNTTGAQALAVAGYGTNLGFSAVGFYGYQDTLRTEKGVQFHWLCYIEGAVEFIFGQHGHVFFHRNTITLFIINESKITTSAAATTDLMGQVFLGRPWSAQAQVAYISCWLDTLIDSAGWESWSASMPQTDGVLFAEYASTGPGAVGPRAPFATQIASLIGYGIAEILGANWGAWVDAACYI